MCFCVVCDTAKVRFFKQITTITKQLLQHRQLFAILQKYDFSSKSQLMLNKAYNHASCLRYCKSTIFQANHNNNNETERAEHVVCDTAKVRFFKQITTTATSKWCKTTLFAILQKYDFSSKSQHRARMGADNLRCLRYCKSTIFQANHNIFSRWVAILKLFAILQKYDFSSKSQHNFKKKNPHQVVCDTAKVRFFKQITTKGWYKSPSALLFAILQKYDFSSKSQLYYCYLYLPPRCLRYCKSTIFQANHNPERFCKQSRIVVCDTAKVRFFKQITTGLLQGLLNRQLFAILQKYDFSSKSQPGDVGSVV